MSLARRLCGLLLAGAVLLAASAAQATEARVRALGGNALILPEDELDVLSFPHVLKDHYSGFVLGDVTGEYGVLVRSNYLIAMGREGTSLSELHPSAASDIGLVDENTLDLGMATPTLGLLVSLTLEDQAGTSQVLDVNAKVSTGLGDGTALRGEFEYLSVEDGDSGILLGVLARKPVALLNGAFNLGLASFTLANLGDANQPRTIEAQVGLARNQEVMAGTRLIYGASVGLQSVDEGDLTIMVPTVGGVEQQVTGWLDARAALTRYWMYISPDQGDARMFAGETSLDFGASLHRGNLSLDWHLANSLLEDSPFSDNADLANWATLSFNLP
ncbi:MAG: hypothetical protein AB1505_03385 [Candidatus Latescibacterota bacterium]